jgi:hypothetical protein
MTSIYLAWEEIVGQALLIKIVHAADKESHLLVRIH